MGNDSRTPAEARIAPAARSRQSRGRRSTGLQNPFNCLAPLAIGVLVGSCVTRLTPEAEAIRVTTDAAAVQGCARLGEVKGGDNWNSAGVSEENAHRRLRNAAAKLGANTVLLLSTATHLNATQLRGEAFKCA